MPATYQPTQTEKDLVGNKPKWALYQQYLSSSPLTPSTPWPSDNTATLTVAQAEEWAEQHARRYRTANARRGTVHKHPDTEADYDLTDPER